MITAFKCLLVLSASAWLCSCQKESKVGKAAGYGDDDLVTGPKLYPKTGWVPEGASFEMKGEKLSIKAPDGWGYIGYDRNGNIIHAPSEVMSSVSCTCNTSGSCKPFHASGPGGSTSGCTGTCTNCTMKQSMFIEDHEYLVASGGYFSISSPLRLIGPGEKVPAAFDALLLEVPAFKEQLSRFLAKAHGSIPMALPVKNDDGSISAPEGYALIAISIMGRGLITIVPEGYFTNQPGYEPMVKASCDCTKGSCSLKNYTVLGTGSIWCEGNCSGTCTLTTNNMRDPQKNISLYSFTF